MIEKIIQLVVLDLHFIIINYQLYPQTLSETDAAEVFTVMALDYTSKARL